MFDGMNRDRRFIVEIKEDVASGDLYVPVPEEILSELDWYEGADLEITLEGSEIIIRELNQ